MRTYFFMTKWRIFL